MDCRADGSRVDQQQDPAVPDPHYLSKTGNKIFSFELGLLISDSTASSITGCTPSHETNSQMRVHLLGLLGANITLTSYYKLVCFSFSSF